jgi:two-component system CheB/CheR fusion protein
MDAEVSRADTSAAKVAACYVVGVGASAGGLDALAAFVGALPAGLPCVYVIAQHMAPTHRSLMAEILGRETSLPVQDIRDAALPEQGTIYVVPAGHNVAFSKGRFKLSSPPPEVSPKPSINQMFQSMAKEFGDLAVGIVLSGTGADGTRGLLAIKAGGGLTMAQVPETAKYDGMPRSAIEAQVVDRVLAPEHMGADLERYTQSPSSLASVDALAYPREELDTLFTLVQEHTRIDFSSYKLSTVQRRLQRRMVAANVSTLQDYLEFVKAKPVELDALAKETLISVTEFFRDREAFTALSRAAGDLLEQKKAGEELRVWVIGCATGEEAYSVGIVFLELMRQHNPQVRLQIFATDIDNDALNVARKGHYSFAAISELPAAYLERYFSRTEVGYEPVKALRDCITFARQDISVDPPFLRLDLVTCRNVLIYFNNELQSKVLGNIRYALNDEGLLFLGRSETVTQQETLFAVVDRRARIYRGRATSKPVRSGSLSRGPFKAASIPSRKPARTHEQVFVQALADYVGPSMLLDSSLRILHSQGPVSHVLSFPSGTPEMNLGQLIVPELSGELLATLQRALRSGQLTHSRRRRIVSRNGDTWRLGLQALQGNEGPLLLCVFEEGKGPEAKESGKTTPAEQDSEETRLELDSAREQLQTLMEEMAGSNEEMQALNEEIQAANEELQASNEELEAANEELQATNEELISVNEESLVKSATLAGVNSEFESMYNTLDFPVLLFDTALCVRRYNGAAVRVFSMPASHIGLHFNHLPLPAHLHQLEHVLTEVCASGQKQTLQIDESASTYQVLLSPIFNLQASVQGLVMVVLDNSALMSAQRSLQSSQKQLADILQHTIAAVSVKDASGCYTYVNRRFEEMFGRSGAEVLGKTDQQLFAPDLATQLRGADLDTMRGTTATERVNAVSLGGKSLWLESVRFPILDSAGVVRSVCTEITDVTARKHAEAQLLLSATVFEHAGEGVAVLNPQGQFVRVNKAYTDITGFKAPEVLGRDVLELFSNSKIQADYERVLASVSNEGTWQGEVLSIRKDGSEFPQWLTVTAVRSDAQEIVNYVLLFSDITAIKKSRERIEHIASHDELTGLPNRSLLTDRLRHALAICKRQGGKVAVMFIDLDNFKNVNDTLGHDVGDLLLVQAAQRLQHCVRNSDTLARLGGDEFVAILSCTELDEINTIAARVVDFMSASFNVHEHQLFVSASIGISVYPDDGEDSVTLLKNADTAMYRSKERGRNQYQYFANEMKVQALQRMTLEAGLRDALHRGTLSVAYQPKVSLIDGTVVGGEALARWEDKALGHVPPSTFVPIAEAAGLIKDLGFYVMECVLRDMAHWRSQGKAVQRVAVNVSAHQLKDTGFLNRLSALSQTYGIEPALITLELTESALMERLDSVLDRLVALTQLGFELSIDDFGTGYSSLAYLRKLPLDELKVDRSFVDGIATDPDDRSIAKMIIDMAHTLGLRVVAEGVESAQQVIALRTEGCDVGQGFHFHKPMKANQFMLLLPDAEVPIYEPGH